MAEKKKASIGCLFWIILILLVLIIVLINLKPAMEVMEKSGFFKAVEQIMPETDDSGPSPQTEETPLPEPSTASDSSTQTPAPEMTPEPTEKATPKPTTTETPKTSTVPRKANLRNAKIYFVQVSSDAELQLVASTHSVYFDDSPLKETLLELFNGPTATDLNKGYISQIPKNTKLIDVYVKNSVAYIDLNDDFRFNSLERKGHIAQLKQIIYTATEYSTVKAVQFLIEGKKLDYIGPEGVYIGEALTRNSEIK